MMRAYYRRVPGIMSQIKRRKNPSYSVVLNELDDSAESYGSFTTLPIPIKFSSW